MPDGQFIAGLRARVLSGPPHTASYLALGDALMVVATGSTGLGALLALEDAARAYLDALSQADAPETIGQARRRLQVLDRHLADHGGLDDLRIEIAVALRRARPSRPMAGLLWVGLGGLWRRLSMPRVKPMNPAGRPIARRSLRVANPDR